MKKPDFSRIAKSVKVGLHKHSPEILTGIGIAGMITTTVLAVRATPKALILIEEEKRRQNKELYEDAERKRLDSHPRVDRLKPMELVRTTWVCYIPATKPICWFFPLFVDLINIRTYRDRNTHFLSKNVLPVIC